MSFAAFIGLLKDLLAFPLSNTNSTSNYTSTSSAAFETPALNQTSEAEAFNATIESTWDCAQNLGDEDYKKLVTTIFNVLKTTLQMAALNLQQHRGLAYFIYLLGNFICCGASVLSIRILLRSVQRSWNHKKRDNTKNKTTSVWKVCLFLIVTKLAPMVILLAMSEYCETSVESIQVPRIIQGLTCCMASVCCSLRSMIFFGDIFVNYKIGKASPAQLKGADITFLQVLVVFSTMVEFDDLSLVVNPRCALSFLNLFGYMLVFEAMSLALFCISPLITDSSDLLSHEERNKDDNELFRELKEVQQEQKHMREEQKQMLEEQRNINRRLQKIEEIVFAEIPRVPEQPCIRD